MDKVIISYEMTHENFTKIGGQKDFFFEVGNPNIIEGLSLAVLDMCIDEVRHVILPPELAFSHQVLNQNLDKNGKLKRI